MLSLRYCTFFLLFLGMEGKTSVESCNGPVRERLMPPGVTSVGHWVVEGGYIPLYHCVSCGGIVVQWDSM